MNLGKSKKNNGDHEEELMRYAQDFVKEYLTYTKSGEEEFKKRISPYVSKAGFEYRWCLWIPQ